LDKQLKPLEENANATTRARLLYARAALATLRRKPDVHDQLIGQIATQFQPDDLSPLLLAQSGDYLFAQGKSDRAADYYDELKEYFPTSMYIDYAYVGLGEIAYAKKDYKKALDLFTDAIDKFAGSKVKDATVGKAKTLLEMGQYDASRKLFEQIATVREWRGESTAYAVYSMGDIEGREGHWAEAIAYYQRVFVLYQRYLPWVAKAYINCAESFDKLGKRPEAIAHLQEMLRNEKLQNLPEAGQARQLLEQWGAAA
jgi:tetratricopeptide (TPR) repeat protein